MDLGEKPMPRSSFIDPNEVTRASFEQASARLQADLVNARSTIKRLRLRWKLAKLRRLYFDRLGWMARWDK